MVRTDNPSALRDAGFQVGTAAGGVATLTAPLSRIADLDRVPGLREVELSRPLEPLLDASRAAAGFDAAHGATEPPYTGFAGSGVMVGIIDTGIDFKHDDFKNEDGTNRISWIWDQTSSTTAPPSGYSYGREWGPVAINNGSATERDFDGHGTHVSGIAAGNGRGTESATYKYDFAGCAPEAEIVFVKTNFSEAGVLDGVNWMMQKAAAASKPIAINISLGGSFGPHDGTTTLETGLSALAGPGRILVAAAGNERNLGIHSEAVIAGFQAASMKFTVPSYTPSAGTDNDEIDIDGWFPGGSTMTFTVTSPNGHSTQASTLTNPVRQSATADGTIRVTQAAAANGDRNVQIQIWDPDGVAPASGTWTVTVQNAETVTREVDFWTWWAVLGGYSQAVVWTTYLDGGEILTTPSTGDSLFSVAAYITKTSWKDYTNRTCGYTGYTVGTAAPFSSLGPRRDGVQKPEITAPGMGIASTLSANATSPIFTDPCGKTQDGKHTVGQGTSQSSPHVTGAAALLLQADPTLSFKAMRDILTQNTDHDSYTGAGWTPSYGSGKLNINKAINSLVPVVLLSFTAAWEDGNAVLRWELTETEPGASFTLERGPAEDGPFHAVGESVTGGLSFAWTDPDPRPEEPWYRLSAATRDGGRKLFSATRLDPLAGEMRLWQNAPNPFASSTVIAFELDRRREARVDVLDVAGRRVRTLLSGIQPAGRNTVSWDGRDAGGRETAAGIYFYRLSTSDRVLAGRMIRTR
jgi:subtilisin family serine protease